MSILTVRNLNKAFGEKEIFKNIQFNLEFGEKVGIVGGNGAGKTTLLSILAGNLSADQGQIQFMDGFSPILLQNKTSEEWGRQLKNHVSASDLLEQMNHISLEFSEQIFTSPSLSGGEAMRLALTQLFSQSSALYLLDEPTNNLDYLAVDWLIEQVILSPEAMLIISHDRHFLDATVTRILELENGKLTEFSGNYTDYRKEKQRNFQEQLHRYEEGKREQRRIQEAIRQTKEWAEKAHRDSTKSVKDQPKMGFKEYQRNKAKKLEKKAKNDIRRLEKSIAESEKKPIEEKRVYFQLKNDGRVGKRIVEVDNISKSYGDHLLFSNSSFVLLRGEHAALFGPNGCGKSTFLRILEGKEETDSGFCRVSPSSKPFILSQTILDLPEQETPISFFCNLRGRLTGEERILLNNLGLDSRLLSQKIASLSQGERMKLKLSEAILTNQEFLILDEPTNYLDLHARETLEETLSSYAGTLLLVSHDLYFLEKVCNRVIFFDRKQMVKYPQSFVEFRERQQFLFNGSQNIQ